MRDMPLDEYTKLLARDMADRLNAKTLRTTDKGQPKASKNKY